MICALQKSFEPQDILLPDDLRDWIDQYTLSRLVLEAIQTASLPGVEATPVQLGSAFLRPHILLSLLTYCYATGLYGSLDIELNSTQDPMLRHLLSNICPEANALRCFRRRHREVVRECLSEVLRRACRLQLGADESMAANVAVDPFDKSGLDAFAAEAEERIRRAVRLDFWHRDN